MREYFDDIVSGIEAKLVAEPMARKPRRLYALEVAKLGQRLYSENEGVAWCGVLAPFDVLNALGVSSCFVEFIGASLAASGMVESFLERAEDEGFGPDTCAYHRGVMGAALQGLMPEPQAFVATSAPCSAGVATMENLARHFDRDLFMLHVPLTASSAGVDHLARQLREMVAYVEPRTNTKLDPARLYEAMVLSNEARALMKEIFGYAAQVPAPISSHDLRDLGIVLPLFFGTPAAVTVAEAYRDELKRRVESTDENRQRENLRLMWIQNRIQFRNPLERMMAEEHGAVIVIDELNSITWEPIDPSDPWQGIAERIASTPLCSPVEQRAAHLCDLAREYKIDGAIHPCHWGCRQGAGARGLLQKSLGDVGVPMLDLAVDCIDTRAFSEGQLRTRVGAFLEMLASRPSPWS